MQPYTDDYYQELYQGAVQSAHEIVPLVLQWIRPRSVIDVGCGQGAWLAVFREFGVQDIRGVDGDYVSRANLTFPSESFRAHDLRRPLRCDRSFDLVVSLEVAEHLPAECADDFVDSLSRLGPVVLFSAAAPFQGGQEHINEQWPAYWAERFSTKEFVPVDCLRRRIWTNPKVDWWYSQNAMLYAHEDYLQSNAVLSGEREAAGPVALPLVHPKRYLEWIEWGLSQCQLPVPCQTETVHD